MNLVKFFSSFKSAEANSILDGAGNVLVRKIVHHSCWINGTWPK